MQSRPSGTVDVDWQMRGLITGEMEAEENLLESFSIFFSLEQVSIFFFLRNCNFYLYHQGNWNFSFSLCFHGLAQRGAGGMCGSAPLLTNEIESKLPSECRK